MNFDPKNREEDIKIWGEETYNFFLDEINNDTQEGLLIGSSKTNIMEEEGKGMPVIVLKPKQRIIRLIPKKLRQKSASREVILKAKTIILFTPKNVIANTLNVGTNKEVSITGETGVNLFKENEGNLCCVLNNSITESSQQKNDMIQVSSCNSERKDSKTKSLGNNIKDMKGSNIAEVPGNLTVVTNTDKNLISRNNYFTDDKSVSNDIEKNVAKKKTEEKYRLFNCLYKDAEIFNQYNGSNSKRRVVKNYTPKEKGIDHSGQSIESFVSWYTSNPHLRDQIGYFNNFNTKRYPKEFQNIIKDNIISVKVDPIMKLDPIRKKLIYC